MVIEPRQQVLPAQLLDLLLQFLALRQIPNDNLRARLAFHSEGTERHLERELSTLTMPAQHINIAGLLTLVVIAKKILEARMIR